MKKFTVLLALIFILSSCGDKNPTTWEATNVVPVVEKTDNNNKNTAQPVVESHKWYEKYSKEAVINAPWKIILFFHAEWCGTCKRIQKDIFANTIPEWITILEVDYDNAVEMKQKYWVNKTSTLVQIDNTGKKIKLFKAKNLAEIVTNISEEIKDIESDTMEKPKETVTNDVMIKTKWTYQDYSETAFKSTTGKKILFFHATWCSSCKSADTNLQSETIAEGVNIFKVDYDSSIEMRQKYGVVGQHTFVLVDDNMKKIKLMVWGKSSKDIISGLLK